MMMVRNNVICAAVCLFLLAVCVTSIVLLLLYHPVFLLSTQSSSSGNPSLHCSTMSSSQDFSDEDDYSVKSGSASPAPGDTLPWNLPRHERSKRKIQGGSVLDPAERAVLRIAGESASFACCLRILHANVTVRRKTRSCDIGCIWKLH